MATLEKIRSKSVLLLVVIGVALLAFIIGDFLNSGRSFFGSGTTVANVDGTKISIIDFQRRNEEYNQRLQQSNQKFDGAVVQMQVLNEMINEQLLNDEVEALGIQVTNKELTEAMTGATAIPAVAQFAAQMGADSPAMLHDMLFNPGKYGLNPQDVEPLKAQWLEMERSIDQQLKYQKFGALLAGAIQANDLDKEALAAEMSTASTIDLVNVPYTSLDNKDYPVSEEELKARYNEEKYQFETEEELRKIHYIAVNIAPSAADLATAQTLMDTVVEKLKANEGVNAIRNISEVSIAERTVRASDVDAATKSFLAEAAVGAVSTPAFRADVHSVTKLLNKKMDVDTITVNMVQVQGNKTAQDSVLNLLNSGKAFAEVVNGQTVAGQENFALNTLQMGNNEQAETAKKKLMEAGADYFVLDSNEYGALIYKVVKKAAPKQMYDIAEVTYHVYPSDKTVDDLRAGLQEFVNKNNVNKSFIENAIAAGYQPLEATITANDPQINRIESTRKMIQWAFGAEAGSVSPVFDKEGNDKMIALTVDEIIPAGYMPLSDAGVRTIVETRVRNDKKAEALMAKFEAGKGKGLQGYAAAVNVPVDSAVVVTFSQDFIMPLRAMEKCLTAQAPYVKQGSLNGPVKGEQGVFVYEVKKVEKSSSSLTPQQLADRYSSIMGARAVSQMALDILKENKDIENNSLTFF